VIVTGGYDGSFDLAWPGVGSTRRGRWLVLDRGAGSSLAQVARRAVGVCRQRQRLRQGDPSSARPLGAAQTKVAAPVSCPRQPVSASPAGTGGCRATVGAARPPAGGNPYRRTAIAWPRAAHALLGPGAGRRLHRSPDRPAYALLTTGFHSARSSNGLTGQRFPFAEPASGRRVQHQGLPSRGLTGTLPRWSPLPRTQPA
jgi:hypothetical protein